jgi:hypothetical protein
MISDDEDERILDSLPCTLKAATGNLDEKDFSRLLKSIEVVGFQMESVPAITNLTYFMNQQLYLQSK